MLDETADPVVHRTGNLIEAEVDGEIVALHIENGTCYGFNGTATRVWTMLAQPMPLSALRDALVAEFDVDPGTCAADLRDLLSELQTDGLVEFRPAMA